MKLGFSHMLEMVSADAQVVLDVTIDWERGNAVLQVHDVLDTSGKVSLIRLGGPFWTEFAGLIVDEAERCPRLLARAVEQDGYEREAA